MFSKNLLFSLLTSIALVEALPQDAAATTTDVSTQKNLHLP
jgi:hypothetical protein